MPRTYYLAGPMTGRPAHNYPAFDDAAKTLRAAGLPITSPHELHDADTTRPWAEYLRIDLRAMLNCDAVILLRGWRDSQGAQLERTVALSVGMPVHDYADVLASLRQELQPTPVLVAPTGGGRARPRQIGGTL